MNNRRTIVALLATIAVLLALNLVKGERRAEAGVQGAAELDVQPGGGEPYVVTYLLHSNSEYYRVWSDGQVDIWESAFGTCDFVFNGVLVDPVDHPFPVIAANGDNGNFILEFADGRVDHVSSVIHCTIAGEGSDPFCLGDIDRNGDTNFDDLLFVLRDWGACGE